MIKRFIEGIVIAIISGFILKGFGKYGSIQMIKSLYQTFVVEMWPIWTGLVIAVIYWFIRFLLDVRKVLKDHKILEGWILPSPDDPHHWVSLDQKIFSTVKEESSNRVESDKKLSDRINKLETNVNDLKDVIIEMIEPRLPDNPLPLPLGPGHRTLSEKIREKLQKE